MRYLSLFPPLPWKTTLAATAALAIGSLTTYSVFSLRSQPQPAVPAAMEAKTVAAIAAIGYLEPAGEVIALSAPAFLEGARIEQLLVKRGDRVQTGQVVAILDSRDRLQAALSQAQSDLQVARSRLVQVQAGAKVGDIDAQAARLLQTQAELEGQIATQRATIASLEAQLQGERSAQAATIKRIEAELRNAETECGRYNSLYRDGAVSASQRDSICLAAETARERLAEAKANLARIVTTREQQIAEANANLNRTIATVEREIVEAQASLEAVAEVRPVDVQVAQAELVAAQAAVERAQAELDLAYVRSPIDGRVLEVHTRPGELVNNDGVVELGHTDQMYVTAEVYETDIQRVRPGQRATITSDGIIEDLQGTVTEVGLRVGTQDVLGTDPVADADARVVEVKIRLDPEDSQQVAGLTNFQVDVVIDPSESQAHTLQ